MFIVLGSPTEQFSTYSMKIKSGKTVMGTSDKAVDGCTDHKFKQESCTHSLPGEENPWWSVDMGNVVTVFSMDLTNRIDDYPCK